MSGPLDRPSIPGPDDLDRSSQDRETPSQDAQPAPPWSPSDPWQESRRDAPGWDDWPPAAPPPDDYYVEPGPSQDLWAESWDDEAASTVPSSGYEPAPIEPEPWEPVAPSEPFEAPAEETTQVAEVAEPEVAEPEEARSETPGPAEAPPAVGWPTRDTLEPSAGPGPAPVLPDWLAEPLPDRPYEPFEPPPYRPTAEPVRRDDLEDASPPTASERPSWLDAGPVAPLPPFLDVEADVEAPPARPQAEPEPEPEPELEPAAGDSVRAAERWQSWATSEPPAAGPALEHEPAVSDGPAQEPEVEPQPFAESAPSPTSEPEPELAAEPAPTAPPELEPAGPPDEWTEADESTRVLPTTWTPPQPTPVEHEPVPELEPVAGEVRTSLGEGPEPEVEPELESTTAEQAVPWLIGLILLLAGMVIVLLALIFAGPQSLGAPSPEPSASAAVLLPSPTTAATVTPRASASASAAAPTPTPIPVPEYGPLEMVYQGRAAALAPIYLLVHDFTTEDEEDVLAQDPTIDVRRFAWAPDGTVGAGLLADVLVSIEPGESKRNLGEGLVTVTFGADASRVYAVRVTADGADDVATIMAIDFASGDASELASVTYPRPTIGSEAPLPEAQFTDDGGAVRLYWMSDGTLRLWVLGASTWDVDPETGEVTDLEGSELPILVDPDDTHRISLDAADDNQSTTLRYLDADGDELATATAPGLVSHLRWSRGGDRVVFTVGRSASGGGVLQDLFLWDLEPDVAPTQITNTGAAFGAEWRGAAPRWER